MGLVHAKARRREVFMVVSDSFDAFLEGGRTEVDQQAERHLEEADIGGELAWNGPERQIPDRFQFDEQSGSSTIKSARNPSSNFKFINSIGTCT